MPRERLESTCSPLIYIVWTRTGGRRGVAGRGQRGKEISQSRVAWWPMPAYKSKAEDGVRADGGIAREAGAGERLQYQKRFGMLRDNVFCP